MHKANSVIHILSFFLCVARHASACNHSFAPFFLSIRHSLHSHTNLLSKSFQSYTISFTQLFSFNGIVCLLAYTRYHETTTIFVLYSTYFSLFSSRLVVVDFFPFSNAFKQATNFLICFHPHLYG